MNDWPNLQTAAKVRYDTYDGWFITYTDYGDNNFDSTRDAETDPNKLLLAEDVETALDELDDHIKAMIEETGRDVPYFVYDLIKQLRKEVRSE